MAEASVKTDISEEYSGLGTNTMAEGHKPEISEPGTFSDPVSVPDGNRLKKYIEELWKSIKKRGRRKKKDAKASESDQLIKECVYEEDGKRIFIDDEESDDERNTDSNSPDHLDGGGKYSTDIWEKYRPIDDTKQFTYDFNHFRRGVAVVIVNTEFSNEKDNRPQCIHDVDNLTDLFEIMDFTVIPVLNKTSADLLDRLKEIRSKLEKDSDCFACLISTHGSEVPIQGYRKLRQHVLNTYDGCVETESVIKLFNDDNCPAMRGKPKLFFIQACRGRLDTADIDLVDEGVHVEVLNQPGGEVQMEYGVAEHQRMDAGSDPELLKNTDEQQSNSGHHNDCGSKITEEGVSELATGMELSSLKERIISQEQKINGKSLDTTLPDSKGARDDFENSIPFADDDEEHLKQMREAYVKYQITLRQEQERQREKEYKEKLRRKLEDADFCTVPCYKDFLVMFSSASERLAWNDSGRGGWLPFCMYEVVRRLHLYDFRTDLLDVLTEVNNMMAVYLQTNIKSKPEWHEAKSAACIYHMLTKDIYFRLKWKKVEELQLITEV